MEPKKYFKFYLEHKYRAEHVIQADTFQEAEKELERQLEHEFERIKFEPSDEPTDDYKSSIDYFP